MSDVGELTRAFNDHIDEDRKFQTKMERVLFGESDTQEMGMKEKVDTMYDILTGYKSVKGFFGGTRSVFTFLIVLGAVVALFKGWLGGLVMYLVSK